MPTCPGCCDREGPALAAFKCTPPRVWSSHGICSSYKTSSHHLLSGSRARLWAWLTVTAQTSELGTPLAGPRSGSLSRQV